MDVYTEQATSSKPEDKPSKFLDFPDPLAAHALLARARGLLDVSDAEPPHDRECWAVEAVHRGSDWPSGQPRRASRSSVSHLPAIIDLLSSAPHGGGPTPVTANNEQPQAPTRSGGVA